MFPHISEHSDSSIAPDKITMTNQSWLISIWPCSAVQDHCVYHPTVPFYRKYTENILLPPQSSRPQQFFLHLSTTHTHHPSLDQGPHFLLLLSNCTLSTHMRCCHSALNTVKCLPPDRVQGYKMMQCRGVAWIPVKCVTQWANSSVSPDL